MQQRNDSRRPTRTATAMFIIFLAAGCASQPVSEQNAYRLTDNRILAAEKTQACQASGKIAFTNGATASRAGEVHCVSKRDFPETMRALTPQMPAIPRRSMP